MKVKSLESRVKSQKGASFPRSAWERNTRPLCGPWGAPSTRSVGISRSHAERGNEVGGRSALTLIELLVVIVILTTIVAAAIPIMSPANDDRRLREATRGLNTFIMGAQSRAISTGRPYGIALKRLSQDTNTDPTKSTDPDADLHDDNAVCLEVFYVEQPAPYAGFDANSRARVSLYEPDGANLYGGLRPLVLIQFVTRGNNIIGSDGLPKGWDPDLFPSGMIRPRDVIEINGTRYQLLSDLRDSIIEAKLTNGYFDEGTGRNDADKATMIVALPLNDTGQMVNITHDDYGWEAAKPKPDEDHVTFFTYPAPYKILRQAAPTSDEPYQLPEGTAIDLRASGLGVDDYFYVPDVHDNSSGVLIMFAPEGRVSRLSYTQIPNDPLPFDDPVVDNIFLLVGKRENIPAPLVDADPTLKSASLAPPKTPEEIEKLREPINWLSGNSRWIVVGSLSGRVVTIENAFVDPLAVINKPTTSAQSSEELRNEQIQYAREFTREMSQLGGR